MRRLKFADISNQPSLHTTENEPSKVGRAGAGRFGAVDAAGAPARGEGARQREVDVLLRVGPDLSARQPAPLL